MTVDLNGAASASNSAALYVAGSTAASVLAPSAILTDPDGPGVVRIKAQTSGVVTGDVLKLTDAASAAASAAGATATFDSATGTLTVEAASGQSLSLALAKTIVQGVSYLSTDTAAANSRTVTFSVFDVADGAPGTATATVTIASAPYGSITTTDQVTTLTLAGDPAASTIVADLAQHRLTGDGASLQVKTTGASLLAVTAVDAHGSDRAVRILGDQGANVLVGSNYDDVITGGLGKDVLTGHSGRDVFVFGDMDTGSTASSADTVTDFTSSDVIRLPAGLAFNAATPSNAVKDAWVEATNGRAYVVFETDATGAPEGLRYIDIGPASAAQRAFFYDPASGDLTMKASLKMTSDVATLKVGETAKITFTFSDAPVGFTADDLTATGGLLGTIQSTTDSNVFTASFTPTASNSLAAGISFTGGFTDPDGNAGVATNALSLTGDTLAPSLAITASKTALKSGETATVTFTFSETPTGFAANDLEVTGGAISGLTETTDAKVYTALFTPTTSTEADASISLSGSYADAAGNTNASVSALHLAVDTLASTLTISADKTALKSGETATVTFTFSEEPTGFTADDLTVTGGLLGTIHSTGDAKVFTATFTPNASDTLAASISLSPSGYFTDKAGNAGASTSEVSLTGDTLAPSLTITANTSALKAGESANVTFTFTETPIDFTADDVHVEGGAISGLTQTEDAKVYTALFTPTTSTEANASISLSGSYTDDAGNTGGSAGALHLAVDTKAPTVTVSADKIALKSGETATVTFTFSETPTGFAADDLNVTGGAISGLTQTTDAKVYTALFTPTTSTEADASIALSGSYTDAAGNTNASVNALHLAVDTLASALTISADKAALKSGENATVTFTFSEEPTGFTADDLTVTGGLLGTIHSTGDAKVFTATFTPNASDTLAASISLSPSGSFTDKAGNAGASTSAVSLTGDTLAPSLTITANTSALKVGESANVTFTFTETPIDFTADDVHVEGGAISGLTQTEEDAKVYKALFTPTTSTEANASISLSGAYTDDAGNAGASAGALHLAVDTKAPTVTISAAKTSLNTGESTLVTFAFSEAPVGFDASDLTVVGGTLGNLDTSNASAITALFTPTGSTGAAAISVAGAYADAAGNAGGGANLALAVNLAPTLSVGTSARVIDENANNTGRAVSPNNIGLGVYGDSTAWDATYTTTITDADNINFSGGYLNAHIINRAAISNVGGDVLGLSSSREQFRIDANGEVFYRQDTLISGKDNFTLNTITYQSGDLVVKDTNSADDVKIGWLAVIGGVTQNGKFGADLRINLNDSATTEIVQLLAANVAFSVRLSNGDTTQAWENFLPASGMQQSVQFTLDDGKGGVASVSRQVNVTADNDAPTAVGDSIHVDAAATAPITGNVLTNDTDPDNLGGTVAPVQTLSVTTAAGTIVSSGATTVQGAHGVLTISADGSYSYQLDAADSVVAGLPSGQQITDTFSYTVTDNGATPLTGTANLVITIDGAATAQNHSPTAVFQSLDSLYGAANPSGSLLTGATDSDVGQTLHVVIGSIAKGTQPVPGGSDTSVDPVTITGAYGSLTVQPSGDFVYALKDSPPLFNHVTDTFSYTISDGNGGTVDTGVEIYTENLPFRLTATAAGDYNIKMNGQTIATVNVDAPSSPVAWAPSDLPLSTFGLYHFTATPVLGGTETAELSVDLDSTRAPDLCFWITNVSGLSSPPETAVDFTIVTDTRAAISAADTATSVLNTLQEAGRIVAVVTDSAEPSNGANETVGLDNIPIVDYLGLLGLPSAARTIDEDTNNTGRLLAFNGFGSHIYSESEDTTAVGVSVAASTAGFAGGVLTAHINNRVGVSGVAGEALFIKTASNLFRIESSGDIYFRQDTLISGSNDFAANNKIYAASDAVVTDNNALDDIKIGSILSDATGTLDGKQGRDLSISLTEDATSDIVQLLAGQIGFAIGLSNGEGTQAWTKFADVTPQASVTFTLTDHDGTTSATRGLALVAHNDAPAAHNDLAAIGKASTITASGFSVLSNDDPDVLPNQGYTGLPSGLIVTDVWTDGDAHGTLGVAFQGAYGTLTLNADGTYGYTVNGSNADVAGLTSGFLVDTFHYAMTDGSATSTADLRIMIDTLNSHWGPENKTASYGTATAETIYHHAASGETQYLFGFGNNDKLGAVGPGTVKIDGGDGDDVMYALATNTSLTGGAGADKFVIGSAAIHVRIEDIGTVTSNATYSSTSDVLDLSSLFSSMTATDATAFLSSHMSQATDSVTGKVSTMISFDGLGGATHTGDVMIVGMNTSTVQSQVQIVTTSVMSDYTLLDELKLIATNHG